MKEVLSYQKKAKEYLPLGLLCVELGFLTETELSLILKTHKYKLYLGELLVNMSLITPSQLAQALEEQKRSGKKKDLVIGNVCSSNDRIDVVNIGTVG